MKNPIILISLLILISHLNANANRSLYVNDFSDILGNTTAEESLLTYAQNNGIETLLLYELHIVNSKYNLIDTTSNSILADFISKAKTKYGIVSMGAVAEHAGAFTQYIDPYNNSRSKANEKFDIYNLEFEFWLSESTENNGYYCENYLKDNGLPCSNDGAFQFFISTLKVMKEIATKNVHPITVEAYVGWPTAEQAKIIGENLDRLRVHNYISDPHGAYHYVDARLIDYANGNPEVEVSIIFSSEEVFMQDWLADNSMGAAEDIFITDWTKESAYWNNSINLEGFTYFAYTYIAGI